MTTVPPVASNYTILVVDDTPANLSVLAFMLQQEGFPRPHGHQWRRRAESRTA
ncbi:MAG: hypothetical protein IPK19_24170 [Chloroflexi bacterium]|nr:hypothetical protein [Chloroflexota bacterium]